VNTLKKPAHGYEAGVHKALSVDNAKYTNTDVNRCWSCTKRRDDPPERVKRFETRGTSSAEPFDQKLVFLFDQHAL
jgi:hypothetical protein